MRYLRFVKCFFVAHRVVDMLIFDDKKSVKKGTPQYKTVY
jgi:hypothetical protein